MKLWVSNQVEYISESNYWHNCWSAKGENWFLIIQIDASYHNHDDVIKCTTREHLTTQLKYTFQLRQDVV
jgi:ribose 1,5-bisphosphokinase PhnN